MGAGFGDALRVNSERCLKWCGGGGGEGGSLKNLS